MEEGKVGQQAGLLQEVPNDVAVVEVNTSDGVDARAIGDGG